MSKRTTTLVAGLCAASLTVGLGAASAQATLIASDSFIAGGTGGYTAGDLGNATGGSPVGLTGDWSFFSGNQGGKTNGLYGIYDQVTTAGLTFPGVAASGGAVQNYKGGSGSLSYTTPLSSPTSVAAGSPIYFSALVNVSGHVAGGAQIQFSGFAAVGVGINDARKGYIYSVASGAAGEGGLAGTPVGSYTADTTYLVVGKVVGANSLAANDTIELVGVYAAGDSVVEPVTPLLTYTGANFYSPTNNTLAAAGVLIGKSNNTIASGTVDELRIGTTFADVTVPEPGSLMVLASGAGLMLMRRKRPATA